MKLFNYLIAVLFLTPIGSLTSYGQGYQLTGSQSNMYVTGCDSTIHLNVSMEAVDSSGGETFQIITQGTNPQTSSLLLYVQWGDGTVSTHNGSPTGVGSGIVFSPPLAHVYPSFDDYTIFYQVTNPQNNSFIWDTLFYTYANCDSASTLYDLCVSGVVFCDQDSNNVYSAGDYAIPNALINFTYNGVNWSETADQNGQYSTNYQGYLGNAVITSVNQSWLFQHGYSSQSNQISFPGDTCGNQPTLNFPIHCNPDTVTYQCISGRIFCDANGNNTYESGETLISNASLMVWNGSNYTPVYSDSSGMISYCNWFNSNVTSTYINIPPVWLNSQGYSYTNGSVWFQFGGPVVDIPINCNNDTTTTPSYDLCLSGTVYCDQDTNGVFSAGDIPLSNASVNLEYNGVSFTATADQNGHYSFTYQGMLGNTAYVAVDQNWLYQNGYGSQPNVVSYAGDTCGNQPTLDLPINCNIDTVTYHCISAKIFCDANGNGIHEPSEMLLTNAPVNVYFGMNFTTLYSDSLGMVSYCGWFSSYITDVYAYIPSSWLTSHGYTAPQGASATLLFDGPVAAIPINCTPPPVQCANLYATISPWIGYYQNYSNTIKISYGKYGLNIAGPFQVTLTFPAGVTPVASSFLNQNYTISGNTMTWNYTSTSAIFNFTDFVYFNVSSGITNGTNHAYTLSITPTGSVADCDTSNNHSTLNMIVGQSYDPNDKSVHNQKYLDPMAADVLTYVIRFQNTGTAPAQDVYIIDSISSNLDLNTLEILETSHNLNVVDLGNGVIKFDYPQIWLPDSNANEAASHGYVIYKIKEKENNPIGSVIENTAYIYFDWNAPIITNTTININEVNAVKELRTDFSVYPNPFNDQIRIKGTTSITGYEFIDAAGKVILKQTVDSKEVLISTSELTSGLYYLNILSEEGNSIQKVIKH